MSESPQGIAQQFNLKVLFAVVGASLVLYLLLAIGSAVTKRPEIDEGMFANPAYNLLEKGFMGTTVLESGDSSLKSIQRRTYWTAPLHLVSQAGWYWVFGFGLFSMRALSIVFGLVALAAWAVLIRKLSRHPAVFLLTVVLLALDYTFIVGASLGRMDIMSAALGFAGLASYLGLRERSIVYAILVSQSFVVLSGLSHPNGILHFFGLLFLTIYYDRTQLRWRHLFVAALPYVIGSCAWGAYIVQEHPSAFIAQAKMNSTDGGRLANLRAPWLGVLREFTFRYPHAFGLGEHSAGHSGPIYLKSLILLPYILGLLAAILTPGIRRQKGPRTLLILIGIYFILLSLIDGQKETPYLIHIFPFYVATLAFSIQYYLAKRSLPSPILALGLGGLLLLEVGGTAYRIKQDTYHSTYLPAIDFLKSNASKADAIMGNSALGFGLVFPDNLVDDPRLGYGTGKRPEFIVFDSEYAQTLNQAKAQKPEFALYVDKLFRVEYEKVYDNVDFKIYKRR